MDFSDAQRIKERYNRLLGGMDQCFEVCIASNDFPADWEVSYDFPTNIFTVSGTGFSKRCEYVHYTQKFVCDGRSFGSGKDLADYLSSI